jgi:Winged helix DNA-binding domain
VTSPRVLTVRALNRALLERQWLSARVRKTVPATVEHLLGLQAQSTMPPYVALWSRLEEFRAVDLSRLLLARCAVRLAFWRSTIHLVTARDCLALRPLVQAALERGLTSSQYARRLAKVDLAKLATEGRTLVEEAPRTTAELGALLAPRFPSSDAEALGYALRALLALVQVTPRGVWGQGGLPKCTTAEAWLGRPLARAPEPAALVRRYLAAFGPASAGDLQAWSGLPACKELVERVRATLKLRVFLDEKGRALYDVPRAPLPDPDRPVPPRFLPEYDNAFLGHADRARIVAPADTPAMRAQNGFLSPFLVDGFVRGTWRVKSQHGRATLELRPTRRLAATERAALENEGLRLLAFLSPEASDRDARIART